jgi:hypothetical protein
MDLFDILHSAWKHEFSNLSRGNGGLLGIIEQILLTSGLKKMFIMKFPCSALDVKKIESLYV